jgi:rare lipoprotein A
MFRPFRFLTLMAMLLSSWALADNVVEVQEGKAAYYADSLHGNKTASGEPYDKNALTAAHRKLPFGTRVKVTYLENGKSVEVVINDRGPHSKNRIIDLSGAAAEQLGLKQAGVGDVKLEIYGD